MEHIDGLGDLHRGRNAIQPLPAELRKFYDQAQAVLKHELLIFSDADRALLAESFAEVIRNRNDTCYACAILPDHVHLLIRKHKDSAETMLKTLQEASRARFRFRDSRPATHPVWGGPGWKVFVSTVEQLWNTIRYIDNNPIKIRLPEQSWDFVTRHDGWRPGLR